jgi:hypothetical protein
MDTNLTELFSLFLTAGGLGFVNYFLLSRLDKINISKHNKEDKPLFLILFSLVNYALYLVSVYLIEDLLKVNNRYLSMFFSIILTLVVTIILTFTLFSYLSSAIQNKINVKRGKVKKSSYDSLTVKQKIFNYSNSRIIYIYDLNNNLIDCGFSSWFSSIEDDDFELSIYPFNKKNTLLTYQDVMDHINKNNKESDLYINIDKNIKIIVIH